MQIVGTDHKGWPEVHFIYKDILFINLQMVKLSLIGK